MISPQTNPSQTTQQSIQHYFSSTTCYDLMQASSKVSDLFPMRLFIKRSLK